MINKLLISFGLWLLGATPVLAATSCSASVTPHSVQTSSTQTFSVTITNTGTDPLIYVRATAPSPLISIQGKDAAGWSGSSTSEVAQFWGGTIEVGANMALSITASSGESEMSPASWTIEVNNELSTEGTTACGGDLGIEIAGIRDVVPPVLSDTITLSDITADGVTLNWTTSEPTSTVLRYGLGSAFDLVATHETLMTDHQQRLNNLLSNSTYFFYLVASDSSGNSVESDELVFTTAKTGLTEETRVLTVTNTVTQTTTQTNTVVRLLVDATPPVVTLTNTWEEYYDKGPTITGTARDNKMIVAVDYSIDRGKTWRPVDIENRKTSVSFAIDLPIEEEGNYDFQVRAYDAEGNKGVSKTQTIVIDRLPPLFGATYLSWGSGLSVPTAQERVVTMVGLPLSLMLSAVGGPTSIIISNSQSPISKDAELVRDGVSGRWFGKLKFVVPGETTVMATGVDGLGRTTTSALFQATVLPAGTIVNEANEPLSAEVIVMARNAITGVFAPWDGAPFGRSNPTKTNEKGEFGLVLPPGTYYLKISNDKNQMTNQIQSSNYKTQTSDMFTLSNTGLVRANVILKPRKAWSIGQWRIELPDLMRESFKVELVSQGVGQSGSRAVRELLLQKSMPEMEFKSEEGDLVTPVDWLGQTTVLLVDAPWLPSVGESIGWLQQLAIDVPKVRTVWVASLHGASALQGIRARTGGMVSAMVADDKALLTEYLGIHQLPVSVVIDRLGGVKGIYRGIVPVEVVKQVMEE